MESIGYIPPAEAEAKYYCELAEKKSDSNHLNLKQTAFKKLGVINPLLFNVKKFHTMTMDL